jgi:hypothetical protein
MEHTTFFEHYRVSTGEDESVQEVSRTGAAINYKAIDTRETPAVKRARRDGGEARSR